MKKLNVTITMGHGWYTDLEGVTFEVYDNYGKDYILVEDYDLGHDHYWRHIDRDGCVVSEAARVHGLGAFKEPAEMEGLVIHKKERKHGR
jgi:hypothetical protein